MDLTEVGCGLGSPGSGYRSVAGFCEYGNDPLDSLRWQGISLMAEQLLALQGNSARCN
jgi:hypothetical protein